MAQDYNIYIRGKSTTDQGTIDTVPFDNRPGIVDGSEESVAPFIQKGISEAEDVLGGGFSSAINTGVAMLTKAVPWLALLYTATKITDKVITTGATHMEDYTGNYNFSMGLNNLKTTINNVINPAGYGTKVLHFEMQANKERKRIEQEKQLIGNSMLGKVKIGI